MPMTVCHAWRPSRSRADAVEYNHRASVTKAKKPNRNVFELAKLLSTAAAMSVESAVAQVSAKRLIVRPLNGNFGL